MVEKFTLEEIRDALHRMEAGSATERAVRAEFWAVAKTLETVSKSRNFKVRCEDPLIELVDQTLTLHSVQEVLKND